MSGNGERHVLIVGCGYTGQLIAQRLTFSGDPVIGTGRSEQQLSIIRTRGAKPIHLDATGSTPDLSPLDPWRGRVRAIIHSVPPAMHASGDGYDDLTTALLAKVASWDLDKIVYISSTSVYGDLAGAACDEATACLPDSPRGAARLAIERQILSCGIPACVVRPAGIYGPGRSQLHRIAAGRYRLVAGGTAFTNRIHVSDLAAIVARALSRGEPGAVYLGTDEAPATQREVVDHVVDTYGLPAPQDMSLAEARIRLSKNALAMILGSKRLDGSHTRERLGVELRYPSFREGLVDVWRRDEAAIKALMVA